MLWFYFPGPDPSELVVSYSKSSDCQPVSLTVYISNKATLKYKNIFHTLVWCETFNAHPNQCQVRYMGVITWKKWSFISKCLFLAQLCYAQGEFLWLSFDCLWSVIHQLSPVSHKKQQNLLRIFIKFGNIHLLGTSTRVLWFQSVA